MAFVVVYFVWVIGYTFQTSCTRAGQTVLTNDPNQRPMFTIFNTVGSLLGMGVMGLSFSAMPMMARAVSSTDMAMPMGVMMRNTAGSE